MRLPTTVRFLKMSHVVPGSIYVGTTYISTLFKGSRVHGVGQCFSTLNFFFFENNTDAHITDSIPGNKDSVVSQLRITINLLKSLPDVFRVQSRLRTRGIDILQLMYLIIFLPILMAIRVFFLFFCYCKEGPFFFPLKTVWIKSFSPHMFSECLL